MEHSFDICGIANSCDTVNSSSLPDTFGVVLQARSRATRLPGKMTLPFYQESGILQVVIEKTLEAFDKSRVVLATTDVDEDDVLVDIARTYGIGVYRGSESDVLQRFIECTRAFGFQHILRVCADNPFLRPEFMQSLVDSYFESPCDYHSYAFPDGTPTIRSHIGLFAEMASMKALEDAAMQTDNPFYHEHVTNYIYSNENVFRVKFKPLPLIVRHRKDIRLTVDTQTDFTIASALYALLKSGDDTLEALVNLVDQHPEYLNEMKQLISTYEK
jgi:spore coat polysaccharide biosynthesis protein SpsF